MLLYRMQGAALRALLALIAVLPFRTRRRIMGAVTGWAVMLTPLRRRGMANLALIWPDMTARSRRDLLWNAAHNIGRTLSGIWFAADFAMETRGLVPEGPGLDVLREAKATGRGAVIVSGHFGQWEAIRHVLRHNGLETGAIYRPNNNPHYEPIFRKGIERGGAPIIAKGRAGNRDLLRHLRSGGFIALLPDQHVRDGPYLDFLGHPARTSLAAAELALRYDAPLVPAFAPEEADGRVRIVIEAPIPPTEAESMMRAFNARLGSWVERYPSQWHWLHRRWKQRPNRPKKARQ